MSAVDHFTASHLNGEQNPPLDLSMKSFIFTPADRKSSKKCTFYKKMPYAVFVFYSKSVFIFFYFNSTTVAHDLNYMLSILRGFM